MRFAAYGRMAVYRSKHTFSNAGLPPAGRKHVVLSYHKQPGRAAHGNAARIENHTFQRRACRGQVYAYLRCYVRDGEIPFSVTVFDETPPDTARFGFAVTPDDAAGTICSRPVQSSRAMRCGCTVPGNRRTCRCAGWKCRPCGIWPAVTSRAFTGAPKVCSPLRRSARRSAVWPRVGGILPGNAFLYDVSEPAFGAAFPVPAGAGVPSAAGFGTFVVVPY